MSQADIRWKTTEYFYCESFTDMFCQIKDLCCEKIPSPQKNVFHVFMCPKMPDIDSDCICEKFVTSKGISRSFFLRGRCLCTSLKSDPQMYTDGVRFWYMINFIDNLMKKTFKSYTIYYSVQCVSFCIVATEMLC